MDSFARHIISWYAGVHVDAVAAAERVEPARVRLARAGAGKSTEYGLAYDATLHRLVDRGPQQLSLASEATS